MAFSGQKIPLAHNAIQEFVMTRTPKHNGIYPILNLIVLLIQKPVLLVVFTEPIAQIKKDLSNKKSKSRGWVHSLQTHKRLKSRFDEIIAKQLSDDKKDDDWLIKIPVSDENDELTEKELLGIFYLHAEYISEDNEDNLNPSVSLDIEETDISSLSRLDLKLIRSLILSITQHSSERQNHALHLNHLVNYWETKSTSYWPSEGKGIPKQFGTKQKVPDVDITIDNVEANLAPIIQEVEYTYRELRGGEPGDYSLKTRDDAGAPLIWSRQRELKRKLDAKIPVINIPSPPTIAFFMQVRMPSKSLNKNQQSYKIVPIVPPSQCKDIAAALIIGIENNEDYDAEKHAIEYLDQIGVTGSKTLVESHSIDDIANAMHEALNIKKFLKEKGEHSITYPTFISGLATFLESRPCSRTDRVLFGSNALNEQKEKDDEPDMCFIKPTSISGFPFVALATKTSTKNGKNDTVPFDQWYYNYTFHLGIIRRWVSRRLRFASEKSYLDAITRETKESLKEHAKRIDIDSKHYEIVVNEIWYDDVSARFKAITQTLPFALVRVELNMAVAKRAQEQSLEGYDFIPDSQSFMISDLVFYFTVQQNPYFSRKLVKNDRYFIKPHKIKRAIQEGYNQANHHWSHLGVLDS